MKKPKIYFSPIEGSAPLTLAWHAGPKGNAIEADKGHGVGFFSPNGELLAAIFDDVSDHEDLQALSFVKTGWTVQLSVTKGKIQAQAIRSHRKAA
jgi:hypothetical protein